VSIPSAAGLAELRDAIYLALDVVRVYTRSPAKREPDYEKPYTLRRGQTLLDAAELVHKDFLQHFHHARVWGSAVQHGSQVKGDYVLHDKDVIELHTS
jgi:uncharacterized protein